MKRLSHRIVLAIAALVCVAGACGGLESTPPAAPEAQAVGSQKQSLVTAQTPVQQLEALVRTAPDGSRFVRVPLDVDAEPVYRDGFGQCQPGSDTSGIDWVYIAEMFQCGLKCAGGIPCALEDGQGGCALGCMCGSVDCDPYDDGRDNDVGGGGVSDPTQYQGM